MYLLVKINVNTDSKLKDGCQKINVLIVCVKNICNYNQAPKQLFDFYEKYLSKFNVIKNKGFSEILEEIFSAGSKI